jgi:ribosomal protein S3
MRSFAPIASLFIKYLHPQILADHIAKEFEKTKYHKSIIYNLSTCLRSLPLRKAKGYRISIAGRINSSDKSRVFILKRNVLVRHMNFAYAQARGRIGSFGIKV